jgi:tRNA pseudouridine55 synthase
MQEYPPYSSKTIRGKALFEYARMGENIEAPEREILVQEVKFISLRKINARKLLQNVEKRIKKVKGDFRQKDIVKIWRENLVGSKASFFIASFKIKCGSGTYVRGIANSLGEKISLPALAFSIKRTKIGHLDTWR